MFNRDMALAKPFNLKNLKCDILKYYIFISFFFYNFPLLMVTYDI